MLYYMYKNKTKSCLLLFVTVLDAANPIILHVDCEESVKSQQGERLQNNKRVGEIDQESFILVCYIFQGWVCIPYRSKVVVIYEACQ